MKEALADAAIEQILEALVGDLGLTTSGLAVTFENETDLAFARTNRDAFFTIHNRHVGSFGSIPPDATIEAFTQEAFDVKFSIPLVSSAVINIRWGGAIGLIVWQSDELEVLTGWYAKYKYMIGPQVRAPYVSVGLSKPGGFTKMSDKELWDLYWDPTYTKQNNNQTLPLNHYVLYGTVGLKSEAYGHYHMNFELIDNRNYSPDIE